MADRVIALTGASAVLNAPGDVPLVTADGLPFGTWLTGEVHGWKRGRSFTPQGETQATTVYPKVGLRVDDVTVVEVRFPDDMSAQKVGEGARGAIVTLPVVVRPPFNGRGGMRYSLPGVGGGGGAGWE